QWIGRYSLINVGRRKLLAVAIVQPTTAATCSAIHERLDHHQPIQPRGNFIRVGQRRGLLDCRQSDLLHDLIDGLPLANARKSDGSQPAVVLGESRLPVDRRVIHPLIGVLNYYRCRWLAVLAKNGHNQRSIINFFEKWRAFMSCLPRGLAALAKALGLAVFAASALLSS